jgi:hypothetical protein
MVDFQISKPLSNGIDIKQKSSSSVILIKDARRRELNHLHLQVEGRFRVLFIKLLKLTAIRPLKQMLTARSLINAVKALHSASTPL